MAQQPEPAPEQDPQAEIEDILREATQSVRWAVGAPASAASADDAERPPGGPRVLPALRAVRASGEIRFDNSDHHGSGVIVVEARPQVRLSTMAWVAIALGVVTTLVWFRVIADGTVPTPAKLDPVYAEASLRHAMAITIRRIDDFEKRYDRVPTTIVELGPQSWPPITYETVDIRRYRLNAAGPNNPIEYDSIQPAESFLANTPEFLKRVSSPETP
jgi:hypothetical protein